MIVGDAGWEFVGQVVRGVEVPHAAIRYRCPCCGGEGVLPLRGISDLLPNWYWNGDLDKPTLTPAISRRKTCGWLGYLREGRLVSAP